MPSISPYSRSIRAQKLWNVVTIGRRAPPPTRAIVRSRISPAALFVKVIARICQAGDARAHQVGDSPRDDAGLAAARARQHQQRPVHVRHGLDLLGSESVENVCGHSSAFSL